MAHVLIVDDHAAMRSALAEAVRDLGHDVLEAPSGEAALSLLLKATVDAAFVDLRMPGMDGLELLKRIRAFERPPVVSVLTAHATAANTIEAMRMGAFDHLTKPVGRSEVAGVVSRMLEAARAAELATTSAP